MLDGAEIDEAHPVISIDEVNTFANNMLAYSNEAYEEAQKCVQWIRVTATLSIVTCAAALRLYYVLYHAPLRHAWRIREKNRKMISYYRYMIGLGSGGIAGLLFLVSPVGFPQRVWEKQRLAEDLEALGMRSLVLRENIRALNAVKSFSHSPASSDTLGFRALKVAVRIPKWEENKDDHRGTVHSFWRFPSFLLQGSVSSPTTWRISLSPDALQVENQWIWARRSCDASFQLISHPPHQAKKESVHAARGNSSYEWRGAVQACQEMWQRDLLEPLARLRAAHPSSYLV